MTSNAKYHLAQLRHLYHLMVTGQIKDTKEAAKGLLGPAIAEFEDELEPSHDCVAMGCPSNFGYKTPDYGDEYK